MHGRLCGFTSDLPFSRHRHRGRRRGRGKIGASLTSPFSWHGPVRSSSSLIDHPGGSARTFTLSDFDFSLPPALIAQHPAPERSASRLLDGRAMQPVDRIFRELPGLLRAGDLLVFNDTRVLKAQKKREKASGGKLELLS